MNETVIDKLVAESNRSLLRFCLIVLGIIGLLLLFNLRYVYNFVFGPFTLPENDLIALTNPDTRFQQWVTVASESSFDTEYRFTVNQDRPNQIDTSYIALQFGSQALLVAVPGDLVRNPARSYAGTLQSVPEPVRLWVVEEFRQRNRDFEGAFFDFMVVAEDFRRSGAPWMILGTIITVLMAYGAALGEFRRRFPHQHPIFRALSRFGDVKQIAWEIDSELARDHEVIGNLNLTDHWAIVVSPSSLEAVPYTDVIWMYHRITQQSSKGRTITLFIHDRYGKTVTCRAPELQAHTMLKAMMARAPWAYDGYTKELQTIWQTQRQVMIAAVDEQLA